MKNKNTIFTVLFIVLVLLILALWIFFFRPPKTKIEQPVVGPEQKHGRPCPGETKIFVMQDLHMKGLLEPGKKFKVIYNYYDCHPVERNDLVYMKFSTEFPPIVRIARGVPGDKFKLKHDQERSAWNILINGDMVKSEIEKHEAYFFGGEPPPTLSLYSDSRKSGLFSDEIIALSSYPPGKNDSGVFGLVKYVDIVGKVEKIDKNP